MTASTAALVYAGQATRPASQAAVSEEEPPSSTFTFVRKLFESKISPAIYIS
jgi:hypothetical protein